MEHKGHPIRVVVKRTGISPHLIRMWERRYGAVTPGRTESGRRLYSDAEIERLDLLRQATREGESISGIAGLSTEQLRELVGSLKVASPIEGAVPADVNQHLEYCVRAMRNLDAQDLEMRLLRASTALGQRDFLDLLLHPLLERTGEMWADGELRVAHEHLASAVVRSLLGSMYASMQRDPDAPLLLSTTVTGQHHEFGALMAAVTAASAGWRTLYLGCNLPAEDIVAAAREQRAQAIALSLVYPEGDMLADRELRRIHELAGGHVTLLVGGRAADSYAGTLREIGARRTHDLAEFRKQVAEVKDALLSTQAGRG